MKLVLIRRTYNDGEYPNNGIIGAIKTNLGTDEIQELWEKWRRLKKFEEDDGSFVDWLVEETGGRSVPFLLSDV